MSPRTAKHDEILRAALQLFGERGYAGASLRELARRVGVQQPSLYHYFRSKEELVEQILDYAGDAFMTEAPPAPEKLDDVPYVLAHAVLYLYEHTDWRHFVRLVFSLSLSADAYQARLHGLFAERAAEGLDMFMAPYVARGEIEAHHAQLLGRMVLNAVGLTMIEQRILYPRHPAIDPVAFADFVASVVRGGLTAIRKGPS
jgi:AcrR family transcriptional regulator